MSERWCSVADEILIEDDGPVRRIVLNRPDARNAQNAPLLRGLLEAVEETARTPYVRVVVLAGLGPSFSAGHDLKEAVVNQEYRHNLETAEGRLWQEADLFVAPVEALRSLRVPTIARVQGHCLAASLMLIGAVDLVVAAEDAVFASRVTRDMGAADVELPSLAWAIGERRAKQLLWTSAALGAAEAQALGLVNWVVPAEALDAKVAEVAESLLAVPRQALALSKLSLRFMEDRRGRADVSAYHFMAHQLSHQTSDSVSLLAQRVRELEARLGQ
jgi:enoyl-CoA hydratase/carnithine racemase